MRKSNFGCLDVIVKHFFYSNLGSTCVIKSEQCQDQFKFKGIYICLDALRGFLEGCRHFVGFDGCHLLVGYKDEFELSGPYGDKTLVNRRDRTCNCRRWDINGISCYHVMATLVYLRTQPKKWIHTCFSIETFK
ncbi:hypothetical protein EUGRSUZ_I00889 [Eucalyptus grandis]|uniref:Uncharacterized protein n=2 Tax=Eucalyptus grandis TaxID=71139 RepID=A0ACC3JDG6_EUCGR|nr:hypothetical protein EUGRSUZ_I00889 [Eucalyptus grandis]